MPEQQMATSADPESLPADGEQSGAEPHDFRAENTRLRQKLAKVEAYNAQAIPYVNMALALKAHPDGPEIIDKLSKGQPLTAKEQKAVAKAAESSPQTQSLTKEEIAALFDEKLNTFEQRLALGKEAERRMEKLHKRATEAFPGYEDIRHEPEWNRRLAVVLSMLEQQAIELPEDESDPYWFAIAETWATLKKEHPELGKEKRARKSESERQGAIVRASSKSAAAPEEEQLSEEQSFARRPIRRAGPGGGIGLSLSQIKRQA